MNGGQDCDGCGLDAEKGCGKVRGKGWGNVSGGAGAHPLSMRKLALGRVWAGRPFWTKKLGQMSRLAWESHAQPMGGETGKPLTVQQGAMGVMFLGHSSFLLQLGASEGTRGASVLRGANVLIDPVFATRLVVLRRQRRAGVRVRDLPGIDAVLVTHAHMDHLNRPTLRLIARRTSRITGQAPLIVVPKGVEDLVAGLGFREVRTLEWWASTEILGPEHDAIRVTMTPAKHWGARLFTDTHRLFGGYVVSDAAGNTVYHSGDTAYFDGFREIGQRLAPQVALLPIGAYFPDSYRAVHTSPEEALQAFVEVGARRMVPMHYGTFRLGREPMDEPPVRLMAEAQRRGLSDRVQLLREGETLVMGAETFRGAEHQMRHDNSGEDVQTGRRS